MKTSIAFVCLMAVAPSIPLLAAGCSSSDGAPSASGAALSSDLTIRTALTLSAASIGPGHAVQASVTYENRASSPVVVNAAVIAARPPGGSHAGGPYDDFQPSSSATTVAPGDTLTVTATRAFTDADPLGAWDVYATYQDQTGSWHDGPGLVLNVGTGGCDGQDAGAVDSGHPPQPDAGSGAPPIVPPISGATKGTWQSGTINGMPYQMLLPAEYSAAHAYPLVLYLHQLDNASQIPSQIDPWFNDVSFRSKFPAIVVAPQCIMDADPSGNTINWGGVSSGSQPCHDNAIALVDQTVKSYSVYTPKIYVTGNSMGGIGSWDIILKYNTKSPSIRPIFAAALILAGATYDWGYPTPDASAVDRLKEVPIWAIHGQKDNQVPLDWDRNTYAAEQAKGGAMRLLVDPNLGHDVWDTYYVMPTAATYWSWLFAQSR